MLAMLRDLVVAAGVLTAATAGWLRKMTITGVFAFCESAAAS
ncbi:MAG TPA: hypothetical protein VFX16_25570 [Pseudonocardiaceae bacterium]|nr:hypothetical protein [Pseudonocardiaceae bacterium]